MNIELVKKDYLKSKKQAGYSNLEFTLTFEQWKVLWKDHWDLRGRHKGEYLMWRLDKSKGWVPGNAVVMLATTAASLRGKAGDHITSMKANRRYPDDKKHKMFLAFIQQRNQAKFRKEGWEFTPDEWMDAWEDKFHLKGRRQNEYCMARIDPTQPWSVDNYKIDKRADIIKYVSQLSKSNQIQTPKGIFQNQSEAAKAYNVYSNKIAIWRKERPSEFYYIYR